MFYPYSAPIILTDTLYQAYGGQIGEASPEMCQIAYQLAEQFLSEDLNTYLLPTTVTGTYAYKSVLTLDHAYVTQVHTIRFLGVDDTCYWTVSGTHSVYASLRGDGEYGQIDLHALMANCCVPWGASPYPYRVQVAYTTGLVSGTSYQPNILLALTTFSTVIVNEMLGFGNESPGDAGVQRYSNQDYSETRTALIKTVYGSSAKANFVHKLLSPLRKRRYVGL